MVALISSSATLEVEREAAMKQAQSASRAAESLIDAGTSSTSDTSALEKKVKAKEEGRLTCIFVLMHM
jgi:Tfp pilus assembly protein PilX